MHIEEVRSQAMSSEESKIRAIVRCFQDIQIEPIRWLWENRIAKGKLTLVVGPPGVGKSQVGLYLAAMASTGKGLEAGFKGPPGKVIILSAEDKDSDSIKPRLEAAGADMTKITELEIVEDVCYQDRTTTRKVNLRRGMHVLEREIAEQGDVSLLLIDPISEYLQGVDSHSNAQVRGLLASLSEIAARYDIAVVVVTHPNKSSGSAIDRVTGSGAFVAVARAVFLVCRDRDDPELRLFLPVKMNMGKDSTGLAFRIEEIELSADIKTSRLVWQPDIVRITADEAVAAYLNPLARRAVDEAKAFLLEALSQGPQLVKDLKRDADGMGVSWSAVRRAQKLLGIRPQKINFQEGWVWLIPGFEGFDPPEYAQDALPKN